MVDVQPKTAATRQVWVRRFMETLSSMGLWNGGDIVGPAIDRGVGMPARTLTETEMRQIELYAGSGLFSTRRSRRPPPLKRTPAVAA